ncbi:hypothetical protein FBY40_0205 [Microbacterium sp. SLBN-154]|uniref:hypothetical protein n=1 Tax=Microbacterium sp. SLBN-154 TaxID=2768458 RepID=UPI0011674E97|nr:hypothetical protein [Microbacterium sp. SLBN-154]TQK17728.1 hypothetical protein FBY40_0205 [Microbacterium sp. SLBN-154]
MTHVAVDSPIQLWDLTKGHYAWLAPSERSFSRTFTVTNVSVLLTAQPVHVVIFVQAAEENAETDRLLEDAHQDFPMLGIVARRPLDQPTASTRLTNAAERRGLVPRTLSRGRAGLFFLADPGVDEPGTLKRLGIPFETFGRKRLSWGGDWAVSLNAGPYVPACRGLRATLDGLDPSALRLIREGPAPRFSSLSVREGKGR